MTANIHGEFTICQAVLKTLYVNSFNYFVLIKLFSPQKIPPDTETIIIITPIYLWGNWGIKGLTSKKPHRQ